MAGGGEGTNREPSSGTEMLAKCREGAINLNPENNKYLHMVEKEKAVRILDRITGAVINNPGSFKGGELKGGGGCTSENYPPTKF